MKYHSFINVFKAFVETETCFRSYKGKGKGKAIQLQAWTGPEGSRSVRLPDFKTIGTRRLKKLSVLRTGRLYRQEIFLALISGTG